MASERTDRSAVLQGTLDLIVLRTLQTMGAQHAYAIATRLQQVSEDLLQLNQGTLYPALVRLEQQGRIKGTWGKTENNREAKFYCDHQGRSESAGGGDDSLAADVRIDGQIAFRGSLTHAPTGLPDLQTCSADAAPNASWRGKSKATSRMLADDFERRGLTPQDARLAARRAYGGVEQAKELHREARSFLWIEQWLKDVRYGVRSLLRTPGFTTVAVVTLALGIGANTAVFSVVNAVLLRPLAYQDPDRLVTLLHDGNGPVAVANYIDWRDQSRSFDSHGGGGILGCQPHRRRSTRAHGGSAGDAESAAHARHPAVAGPAVRRRATTARAQSTRSILSHRLWQRRFSQDAGILGKPVLLNGEAYTVVGVMPPEFKFAPFWATRAELWVPDAFGDRVHSRGGNSLRVFARLKRGVPLARARAEIATITARLEQQYPGTNRSVVVTPLKENVVGKVETPLLVLLCAVGFVLLIACANVAHMLLARTSDRQREIALRTALGASRARVIGQFLTENLLLASMGAAAGLLLASWGVKALIALSPGTPSAFGDGGHRCQRAAVPARASPC